MNFLLQTTDKASNINVQIDLGNELVDGGVYMFLIDNIPLYIGEANYFLDRLSTHIGNLLKKIDGHNPLDYFGLSLLTNNHTITYMILESNLPYLRQLKVNNKRASDINKSTRTNKEAEYIAKYHPLTQWPIWLNVNDIRDIRKKYKIRKKDDMLPIDLRNELVKIGIAENSTLYINIIKELHERQTKMKGL